MIAVNPIASASVGVCIVFLLLIVLLYPPTYRLSTGERGFYLLRQESIMKKLFVGNLPPEATEASVREMFAAFGTVRSIDLAHDIFTGKCKGFGFIGMEGHEARAAQTALDG